MTLNFIAIYKNWSPYGQENKKQKKITKWDPLC